jgi:DNA-binding CsgD family transcriptional regulator
MKHNDAAKSIALVLLQGLITGTAAAIASGTGPPIGQVILRRPLSGPLIARCLPVTGAARDFLGLARVVLAVDDLDRPMQNRVAEALCAALGLTPSEARLAARIGRGEELRNAAAAAAEGISFETGRSRLKTIFMKTDTSRQAELASLVTRLLF